MRLLASRPAAAAPVAAAAATARPLRAARLGCMLARPGAARRAPLRVAAAGGEPGEQPEQPAARPKFPAAAAAARRQQIQRERAAIWGRIDSLVQYDSEEEDSALVDLTGDAFKEADRKNLRTVFDFERWKKHRSGSRYLRHARATFASRITQGLAVPLLYTTTLAAAVATWHAAAEAGIAPPIPDLKIDTTFSLTSFALSLLLAYRTNSSYGRWDEARKMWGSMVNRTRDLARMGLGYIPDSQPGLQAGLIRWIIAYTRALMCHLRDGEDLERELRGVLTPKELGALVASAHRPNYCMQVLAGILREAKLPGWTPDIADSRANVKASAFVRMDEQLTVFSDVTGGCERILRTPIPLSYTRHTSRFLMIWLTILPFTLWDQCGWGMVPLSTTVAFLLLGIEEIGVAIEEPFSVLPLEVISRTIETNVRELERTHAAEAAKARERAVAAAAGVPAPPSAAAAAGDATGQIDAIDLVCSIIPEEERKAAAWGPEWVVLSGTAGPAAVPAAAR